MAEKTDEAKLDGWRNLLSGANSGMDAGEYTHPVQEAALTRYTADAIYRADGIGRRIVDLPADEMTREWVEVQGERGDEVAQELRRINAKHQINKALRWAGLYGGAVAVLLIDDGSSELANPLGGTVRSVDGVRVYDRHQVHWTHGDISDDPRSPYFGYPETMMVQPQLGVPFRVHRDRLLVFDGLDAPDQIRINNRGWGDSRLQSVYRALSRYGEALSGTSGIIRDFVQPTLGMKGLSDMIASGQEEVVQKRLEILGLSRSILNVLLIDAEEESYEKKASSVSGIDKLLEELKHNVSAVSGIPQTKLFGRAPEGMNASGDSQARDWYDQVAGEQERHVVPPVEYLVDLIDRSMGGAPDDREIVCNPLWQPTEQEQATTADSVVKAVTLALDYGAMTPEAAARNIERFGLETGFEDG